MTNFMFCDFTVILSTKVHFGDEHHTFDDIEPHVPFTGPFGTTFKFDCPNIDPFQTAVLMFQSRAVDSAKNRMEVNGVIVPGGIPVSPSREAWNGNVVLIEPHHELIEVGNKLAILPLDVNGTFGDRDDFIIDNMVIMYKTMWAFSGLGERIQIQRK